MAKNHETPTPVVHYVYQYQDNWKPLWWSLGALGWVICGLIHYQILKGQAFTLESSTSTWQQYCPPAEKGKNIECSTVYFSGTPQEVSSWTRGRRNMTLISTAGGPISLFFDFLSNADRTSNEKASW